MAKFLVTGWYYLARRGEEIGEIDPAHAVSERSRPLGVVPSRDWFCADRIDGAIPFACVVEAKNARNAGTVVVESNVLDEWIKRMERSEG